MTNELLYKDESYSIRGAVYEVYGVLGSGFLEEVYQNALEEELRLRGIPFQAKPRLHVMYKGRDCGDYDSPDFICYDKIVVEIKAVERPHPRHIAFAQGLPSSSRMWYTDRHGNDASGSAQVLHAGDST